MTPSGIEPATFQLVAQWLNQLRHLVPHSDELEHPFVVNRGRCIQIKKCIWLQFSRICSREVTPLLSVVFRVVRVVHKFDFRLVTDETPNRWRPG